MNRDVKHPAKYSAPIMEAIHRTLGAYVPTGTTAGEPWVLDPFAGTGRIHALQSIGYATTGVELEPEWAGMHPDTIVGDSTRLLEALGERIQFDAVVTSPCYGNRMADTYDGRDGSTRHTYRIDLGRELSEGSAAGLQWGEEYRALHTAVWSQCAQFLKPGGYLLLNISDHVRNDWTQPVTMWHAHVLGRLGFDIQRWEPITTQRQRQGSSGSRDQRAREEWLLTFRKDEG